MASICAEPGHGSRAKQLPFGVVHPCHRQACPLLACFPPGRRLSPSLAWACGQQEREDSNAIFPAARTAVQSPPSRSLSALPARPHLHPSAAETLLRVWTPPIPTSSPLLGILDDSVHTEAVCLPACPPLHQRAHSPFFPPGELEAFDRRGANDSVPLQLRDNLDRSQSMRRDSRVRGHPAPELQ